MTDRDKIDQILQEAAGLTSDDIVAGKLNNLARRIMRITTQGWDELRNQQETFKTQLAAANADRAAVHAANETLNRERRALLERAEAAEARLAQVDNYGDKVQPPDNWLQPATDALEARGWQRQSDELNTKYRIAIQQLAAANNERGMYGDANRESDAIKRAEEAESALMTALDDAHYYRLKLQDVVSGTAIAELETQLAYYKAMIAAVPEYIESCQEDYAAGIDAPITLEQWFEDVSRQDEDE